MEHEIEVSTIVHAAPARARQAFIDDLGSVLSERCSDDARRTRRFACRLAVELGSGASLHQEVLVQPGAARLVDDVLLMPITIAARERARLFPTFEGEIGVSPDRQGARIRLVGHATVPLGWLGEVGEGLVSGHRLARESLARYVDEIGRRVDAAVDRTLTSASMSPSDDSERRHGHR